MNSIGYTETIKKNCYEVSRFALSYAREQRTQIFIGGVREWRRMLEGDLLTYLHGNGYDDYWIRTEH